MEDKKRYSARRQEIYRFSNGNLLVLKMPLSFPPYFEYEVWKISPKKEPEFLWAGFNRRRTLRLVHRFAEENDLAFYRKSDFRTLGVCI